MVQLIVADEVVTLLTKMPDTAGARLFTKMVAGIETTVLPNSSWPTAWMLCGPSDAVVVSKDVRQEPATIALP